MKGFGWPLSAIVLWFALWPAHSAVCPVWTPVRATEEIGLSGLDTRTGD